MKTFFWYLVCGPLLWLGPFCLAQAVTIRVVDPDGWRLLQKQRMSV
jgi:hypothetical protein